MKKRTVAIIGLITIVLVAYLFALNREDEQETVDIEQLVHDFSVGNSQDQTASITSEQLIVTNSDENQVSYDLPEDKFFVSIAPYIEGTHPCAIHSLTGCQGEMADEEFIVYIEDSAGNVVRNETITSHANGFIDLWLPREDTYQVIITHDEKEVQAAVSTFNNDDTCITTMQLAMLD